MSTREPRPQHTPATFAGVFARALERRRAIAKDRGPDGAWRAFSGEADGVPGVYIDVYGPGAVLIEHEGRTPRGFAAAAEAPNVLNALAPFGVRAVYHKPFARDRSRLGGELPECATSPTPLAGEPLSESFIIREHAWNLEVRLYDGLSTGVFLDQRENRRWVHDGAAARSGVRVLNTFAYTGAFSIAAARAGAITTSVDVSGRYLEWAKRNFAHNGLDAAAHRFAKMDTFEFFAYARRKGLKYDLVILDPPSFASGSKKKGIRPWSSVADYARLVHEASELLEARGVLFASTNTTELCRAGRLKREVIEGLGHEPRWLDLPGPAKDFAPERERFAACACEVRRA